MSSAINFTVDFSRAGRSFMYNKNSIGAARVALLVVLLIQWAPSSKSAVGIDGLDPSSRVYNSLSSVTHECCAPEHEFASLCNICVWLIQSK